MAILIVSLLIGAVSGPRGPLSGAGHVVLRAEVAVWHWFAVDNTRSEAGRKA
jgi:hypothetical protein